MATAAVLAATVGVADVPPTIVIVFGSPQVTEVTVPTCWSVEAIVILPLPLVIVILLPSVSVALVSVLLLVLPINN